MSEQQGSDVRIEVKVEREGDKRKVVVEIEAINGTEIPEDVSDDALLSIAAVFLVQFLDSASELVGMTPIDSDANAGPALIQ